MPQEGALEKVKRQTTTKKKVEEYTEVPVQAHWYVLSAPDLIWVGGMFEAWAREN